MINDFITLLKAHKVVIPPIQRDYAQGRDNVKVNRIRDRFLKRIAEVLSDSYTGEPLKLDFIYGHIKKDEAENGMMYSIFNPLDGQQRLTTLFLIHWYAAVTEGHCDEKTKELFSGFSYATRAKSRQFCQRLVEFAPDDDGTSIKLQLENQPWFFLSWRSDPTIESMLVMLEAIENTFIGERLKDVWEKLTGEEPRILFYLLEMAEIGLPDDLYIKMNSRGKELTDFEHFKSQFSRIIPSSSQIDFNTKVDKNWSDLFWNIFKDGAGEDLAYQVDQGFLNFYNYITDLLIATKGINLADDYWLTVAQAVYTDDENVNFLFVCLDLFVKQEKDYPDYFSERFYLEIDDFDPKKTRLFFQNAKVNLFRKCAKCYDSRARINPFSIGEQLLLYACIQDLQGKAIDFPAFRMMRNLIAASEDQLRKQYLASLYRDTGLIIRNENLGKKTRFSKHQLDEEDIKGNLQHETPGLQDVLFRLEDHFLLRGTLSVFNIDENIEAYALKFQEIFYPGCDYFSISRAMLATDDYKQAYGRLWRFGNGVDSTWRELFTQSDYRKNFDATRRTLKKYLEQFIDNENMNNDRIILAIEKWSGKDWRYYYIKYDSFRKWGGRTTEGFYYWNDFENKPFDCFMMFKRQFNGRHWNPYLLAIKRKNNHCTLEDYGAKLQFTFGKAVLLVSMNGSVFKFEASEEDLESTQVLEELKKTGILDVSSSINIDTINNNEDRENRITKCLDTLQVIEGFLASNRESDK